MRPTHPRSFRAQVDLLRRHVLQDGGLPFTDIFTEGIIAQALITVGDWLDRIFYPLVTLWPGRWGLHGVRTPRPHPA